MDLIFIVGVSFVIIFVLGLIYAKKRSGGETQVEAPVARRLPPPVDNAIPRAAQMRQRRRFNPAHGYEGGGGGGEVRNDENDGEEFDPETMNDVVGLDSKMGKKKQMKLMAKEEKRVQREVKKETKRDEKQRKMYLARNHRTSRTKRT